MSDVPSQKVAVVLEREPVASRWQSHQWQLLGVLPDVGGTPRTLLESHARLQRLFPGYEVSLHPSEAEGYFLNVSSDAPSVFVAIRQDEGAEDPYPYEATLSYNEAARWMDGGMRVERAPAWPELAAWMAEWVERNYRPEPKQRRKPRSFEGKEGRLRKEGTS
jgi:hypothetical protein